jgi:hypothetical protein
MLGRSWEMGFLTSHITQRKCYGSSKKKQKEKKKIKELKEKKNNSQ